MRSRNHRDRPRSARPGGTVLMAEEKAAGGCQIFRYPCTASRSRDLLRWRGGGDQRRLGAARARPSAGRRAAPTANSASVSAATSLDRFQQLELNRSADSAEPAGSAAEDEVPGSASALSPGLCYFLPRIFFRRSAASRCRVIGRFPRPSRCLKRARFDRAQPNTACSNALVGAGDNVVVPKEFEAGLCRRQKGQLKSAPHQAWLARREFYREEASGSREVAVVPIYLTTRKGAFTGARWKSFHVVIFRYR